MATRLGVLYGNTTGCIGLPIEVTRYARVCGQGPGLQLTTSDGVFIQVGLAELRALIEAPPDAPACKNCKCQPAIQRTQVGGFCEACQP